MSQISMASILEVKNLKLRDRQKFQVSNILKRIQEYSPRGAKISGHLKREANHFEGNIRVSSRAGVAVAKAKSNNILSLMMKLQAKIVRQLIRWKENRFSKRDKRKRVRPAFEPIAVDTEFKKEA